jgi:hypothetical protein
MINPKGAIRKLYMPFRVLSIQEPVHGFAIGDFNEDGISDIAAARDAAANILYFGNIKSKKSQEITP